MPKKLVFQLDISHNYQFQDNKWWRPYLRTPELYQDSKASAIKYAQRVGADYFCLTQPVFNIENLGPVYHKLGFYHFFEKFNYDQILLLDCDTIVYDICPDIFEFKNTVGTPTCPPDKDKIVHDHYDFMNIDHGYDKIFCTGVVMFCREFYEATKDHYMDELLYWKDRNDEGTHDQTVLNVLAYKYFSKEKITILSEDWGAWWKNSKFINHYGGYRKRDYHSDKK